MYIIFFFFCIECTRKICEKTSFAEQKNKFSPKKRTTLNVGKEKKNTVSFAFTNFIFVPGEKKIFCNKIVFDENKIFFEERKK